MYNLEIRLHEVLKMIADRKKSTQALCQKIAEGWKVNEIPILVANTKTGNKC